MGLEKGIFWKEKMERQRHVVEREAHGWVPGVTEQLVRTETREEGEPNHTGQGG